MKKVTLTNKGYDLSIDGRRIVTQLLGGMELYSVTLTDANSNMTFLYDIDKILDEREEKQEEDNGSN